MRIDFSAERILAVVAHPDDAECLCAGTLARAKADGAEIGVCVLCQGDKGRGSQPVADLATVRKREMAEAAGLLGCELLWGDCEDGHLADVPSARRELVELVRGFRPTLLLAHAPVDYHPDHRAASALTEAASWFAAAAGHETASAPLKGQPAVWWMDTMNMLGQEPGFFIDVTEYVVLKRQMLACHRSQLQRGADGDFAPLAEQMERICRVRGSQAGVEAAEAFTAHLAWKRARAW